MLICDLPLNYFKICSFLTIFYQFLENLRIEAKIKKKKKKKKKNVFVLHSNFPIIWYVKDKTPNFNVLNFFAIWITPEKIVLFMEITFFYTSTLTLLNEKKTSLRLPEHILGGGYNYNKVVLEFWNFYFLGAKSSIFKSRHFWAAPPPLVTPLTIFRFSSGTIIFLNSSFKSILFYKKNLRPLFWVLKIW